MQLADERKYPVSVWKSFKLSSPACGQFHFKLKSAVVFLYWRPRNVLLGFVFDTTVPDFIMIASTSNSSAIHKT